MPSDFLPFLFDSLKPVQTIEYSVVIGAGTLGNSKGSRSKPVAAVAKIVFQTAFCNGHFCWSF